jgi:hypothetical protein
MRAWARLRSAGAAIAFGVAPPRHLRTLRPSPSRRKPAAPETPAVRASPLPQADAPPAPEAPLEPKVMPAISPTLTVSTDGPETRIEHARRFSANATFGPWC